MSDHRTKALQHARENTDQFLNHLIDFVKIPSVSTDSAHGDSVQKAAGWVAERLTAIGVENVQVLATDGFPVVFGEKRTNRTGAPTLLIYGHYDVQPAEPLELWESDPFNPLVRDDNLYGRGASDMKGQVMASLCAVESVLQQGDLPLNIKFLIEGEEEIGSPHLQNLLKTKKELFCSDVALNADTGMISPKTPSITYGLRGLAYFELRVYGPSHDLHSGLFGGIVHNPAQALCELVAAMHDDKGRVTLPGFYDAVVALDAEERNELARLPITEETLLQQTGATLLWGDPDFTPVERIGARPPLEINGIFSGFAEAGSKTIIPAWAMAKISMRLVPHQNPKAVQQQLQKFLEKNAPKTIRWELIPMAGSEPSLANRDHPAIQALIAALESAFATRPVFKREGGSVPVVGDLKSILGIESVMSGFGLPSDNIHGPNEKLHLPTWRKGIETLINFLYNYGEQSV